MQYNVHEAKTNFSKLLQAVSEGKEVIIARKGVPVAELIPARKKGERRLGTLRGVIKFKEGWERAMSDDASEAFLEGR